MNSAIKAAESLKHCLEMHSILINQTIQKLSAAFINPSAICPWIQQSFLYLISINFDIRQLLLNLEQVCVCFGKDINVTQKVFFLHHKNCIRHKICYLHVQYFWFNPNLDRRIPQLSFTMTGV